MVVAALLLSFLTWWELDIRPRTDDAYLRANIVGIAANVSGYITELNVVDNQKVNVGDLLFRVDVRPYQAELDLAIANLGLVDLEIIALKDAITQRDADVVSAEAKALYDVQFLARMEPLLPRQFVTPDQIDAAKRNVRASDAVVQQAKAAASQARANLGQLGDINVRRQKAQANVVEKQLNVGYCEVRSSVAGYVTNFNTSVGQFAQIGMQVFALVDTSNWYLLANYQETDLRGIEPGMAVEVYLMAYPGVRFHGVAQGDEFVDVELVIGEQHKVLEVHRVCAAVVAQAVQRVVDARRGEQRQRRGLAGGGFVGAVGDAIVHGRQVGQVKHLAHLGSALSAHFAFDVVVFGE